MSIEQSDPNQTRLQAVDSKLLTPIVLKALDQKALTLTDWSFEQIHGGFGGGMGGTFIYRFKGGAVVQDDTFLWSLILKIALARPNEAPNSTHYWKREVEAYRSGLLENLPGRVFAAKLLQVIEYPGESCWIWQEDVKDDAGESWHLEHYKHAARHFGQFNGAYIISRPIPDEPWLGTRWLRNIADATEPIVPKIEAMLRHPLLHPAFPSNANEQFLKLWEEREWFLSTLDKLPQTFAHQDPVRRNLFLRRVSDGEYETIAIDWAYVGQAAVGMDIAVPFSINLAFMDVDISTVHEFDEVLYGGYLQGLRDAGWDGDLQQVRLGFTAATAFKYIEGLMIMSSNGLITDPTMQPVVEKNFGHPVADFIEQAGGLFRYVFRMVDEARQIMGELGYS